MALALSLSYLQQDSCGELVLTDTSGAYNVTTNPTGWGSPNLACDTGAITYAEIIIKTYTDSLTLSDTSTVDVIADWKTLTTLTSAAFDTGTTVSNMIYTIPLNLPDGVHQITYQVGDGATYANSTNQATITYNIATYCNIECCVEQYLADLHNNYTCVTCNNDYLNKTQILWTLLQALKLAACSSNIDTYLTILETLQTACSDAGSTCCS